MVHCRAGVGRTGVLTSLVAFMDQLERAPKQALNRTWAIETLSNIVLDGRKARGEAFVQTEKQLFVLLDMAMTLTQAKLGDIDYQARLRTFPPQG